MDVFEDYFGECTETTLKDNFVIVYEVNEHSIRCFSLLLAVVVGRNAGFGFTISDGNECPQRIDQTA